MISAKVKSLYLLLFLSVIVVCVPRFNRLDFGIKKYTTTSLGDSPAYMEYVEYFRGNIDLPPPNPYSYRPIIPFLSSLIPFDAMTSINLVNIGFLMLALLFLILTMKHFKVPDERILLASFLFSISFPVFYYGAVGIIDSIAIFSIALGVFLIYKEQYWLVFISIFLFAFGKETIIALIPIIFLHLAWDNKKLKKAFLYSLIASAVYLLASVVCHKFFGNTQLEDVSPAFSLDTFLSNIQRPRTWLSGALSLGLPGLISLYYLIIMLKNKNIEQLKKLTTPYLGIVMFICLYLISMLSAYSDGRFIWGAAIFSCLIVAIYQPVSGNPKKP